MHSHERAVFIAPRMLCPAAKLAIAASVLLPRCAFSQGASGAADSGVHSIYTSLNEKSCATAIDKGDPDDTPYLVCRGVAGYVLQVRTVESGRMSITVVSPAKHASRLNFQNVITRSMSELDDKAEWRVRKESGKAIAIALIVRVMAHESERNPEKITHTYLAVAKIAPEGACVTDRILEGSKTDAEVQSLADSAASRPCASRLPSAQPQESGKSKH